MESLHVTVDTSETEDFARKGGRSPLVFIFAIIAAMVVTVGLFAGYVFLRKRHAQQVNAEREAQTVAARPVPSPEIQVFVDDAMIKGSQTTLSGALLNISPNALTDLSVELELRRRKNGGTETRTANVEPKDLAPNRQGRYSLKISSQDYSSARVLRIRSASQAEEVAFKTSPGAQRPPEPPQENKTIIVNQPPPRKGRAEEFINTPDNPAKVH